MQQLVRTCVKLSSIRTKIKVIIGRELGTRLQFTLVSLEFKVCQMV